jgi:hypothetical protein
MHTVKVAAYFTLLGDYAYSVEKTIKNTTRIYKHML